MTSVDEQRALAEAFDPNKLDPTFYENPYPFYAALRRFDPVHRCPDGSYFLSRYADLDRIYRDRTAFSSDKKQAFAPKFGAGSPLYEHHTTSLVFNDAPYHTRVRRQIVGALTPQNECYARTTPAAPVFLLDAETCAALATPLATRDVWPERDAAAIVLERGARFERNGPGWYGAGVRLPDRSATALTTALHALGAPATVLGYGLPPRPTRLSVTWVDGSTSTLLVGRGEYALEGRAVRYVLPKEACEAFAGLCK